MLLPISDNNLSSLSSIQTSGEAQNVDNFRESADGLHKLPAHPGHEVQLRTALCDGLAPLLCAQKLLSIGQESVDIKVGFF